MNLVVFPPSKTIERTLREFYNFDTHCKIDLLVTYKNKIICNSNQNPSEKAKGIPSGYLRLEVKKNKKLYYSYYVDLDALVEEKELTKAFSQLKKDLL